MNKVQSIKPLLFDGINIQPIEVETTEEMSIGEVLIGEIYRLEDSSYVGIVTDGSVKVLPGKTNVKIIVTGIIPGSYGLKIYTEETGVIARGTAIII